MGNLGLMYHTHISAIDDKMEMEMKKESKTIKSGCKENYNSLNVATHLPRHLQWLTFFFGSFFPSSAVVAVTGGSHSPSPSSSSLSSSGSI